MKYQIPTLLLAALVVAGHPLQANANGFTPPSWSSEANALYSEWLDFTSAHGEPGNAPDIAGAEGDAMLRQVVPGAVVTGSGNIYNPAGASRFQVTDEADTTYRSIVLQTKITGSIDPESVFLDYEHNGGTQSLAAQGEELAVKPGAFGSTVVNRWTWDVATLNISKFTLRLQATGAHASLVGARLDTLTAPTSSGELVELLFEEPSNDRWNYPFNATPGYPSARLAFPKRRSRSRGFTTRHTNLRIPNGRPCPHRTRP